MLIGKEAVFFAPNKIFLKIDWQRKECVRAREGEREGERGREREGDLAITLSVCI